MYCGSLLDIGGQCRIGGRYNFVQIIARVILFINIFFTTCLKDIYKAGVPLTDYKRIGVSAVGGSIG